MKTPRLTEKDLDGFTANLAKGKGGGGLVGTGMRPSMAKDSRSSSHGDMTEQRDEVGRQGRQQLERILDNTGVPVQSRTVSSRAGSNPAPLPLGQRFYVPGPLPGANDIIRKNWRVYSKLKQQWGLTIGRCLLVAKIQPMRRCSIAYHWVEPIPVRGHIRDRDNIRFAAKYINDALVTHGILLDDGPDGVAALTDTFDYHGTNPGVLVTLTEIKP